MHTYERIGDRGDDVDYGVINTLTFACAEDVVELARRDPLIGRLTWPETFHVDPAGLMTCSSKGGSFCGVKAWADDVDEMLECRVTVLDAPCPDDWFIIESRPAFMYPPPTVDEGDAEAFVVLRRELAEAGIRLLDAVVFDDGCHWWSMHELVTGTTTWKTTNGGSRGQWPSPMRRGRRS